MLTILRRWSWLSVLLLIVWPVAAQDVLPPGFAPAQNFTVEVLNSYPHDTSAFTQGLLWHDGSLYESTGLRGESTLREVDLTTGEVIRSIDVRRPQNEVETSGFPDYFAEGLTIWNQMLYQLTWTAGEVFLYDIDTFEPAGRFNYDGQGWGLCYEGPFLYMSDSTQYLSLRDPISFELMARQLVTVNGRPLGANLLNELECVGDHIYANLWQTDFILQIDKFTGNAVAVIDASGLLTAEETANLGSGGVLNGIAYNPETETFYITGKLWPRLFEVRFVPVEVES